jgi:acetyl-CoA C-acetyltransferase
MGECGERTAEKYGVTRDQMDLYAVGSHRKAIAAIKEGRFKDEILPVEIPKTMLTTDEGPREDASADKLSTLKPVFRKDGTVTPGNASSINDGAAAVVVASDSAVQRLGLRPLVRITGFAAGGLDPQWVLMAPIEAVKNLDKRFGVKLRDMDLIELNEAFSVQCCALIKELEIDPARLNVNGGAVALGHPIGASGARVLTTLIHALRQRGGKRGLATLCLGGGNAVALSVEAA